LSEKPPTPGVAGYMPMAAKTTHEEVAPRSSLPGMPPGVAVKSSVSTRRVMCCVFQG
jgi:hypothetical protein